MSLSFFSGKYLEGLDLLEEKLLKKYLTTLSSIEWKLTTKIFPPGFKIFVALICLVRVVFTFYLSIQRVFKSHVYSMRILAHYKNCFE